MLSTHDSFHHLCSQTAYNHQQVRLYHYSEKPTLRSVSIHLCTLIPETNGIPSLQDHQGPIQRLLTVSLTIDHLLAQRRQTGAPADGESPLQLCLNAVDFFVELTAALVATLVDCIHGGAQEQTDGFVYVHLGCDSREGEFGEGLSDTDDGFELTDRDGDGGASVSFNLGGMDLPSDGNEVR